MSSKVIFFDDVNMGDRIPELVMPNLTRTQFVVYAGASGDFNPIHHDQTFAEAAGFKTVFAMGMLSMGFLGRILTDYVGDGNLTKFGVRFSAITWPGDTITCKGTVTKKYSEEGKNLIDMDVFCENQKGEKTLIGSATASLPKKG